MKKNFLNATCQQLQHTPCLPIAGTFLCWDRSFPIFVWTNPIYPSFTAESNVLLQDLPDLQMQSLSLL